MQRVTNCIYKRGDQVLLLQKPRRNWYVAPGGKMEAGETIKEAVKREYREETGLDLKNPEIKGIFTFVIIDQGEIIAEWMMFTFFADDAEGELLEQSPEGILKWKQITDVQELPMAPGDYYIFEHLLNRNEVVYGTFHYTPDFQLLSHRLEPDPTQA
ncbi:8-oxo-dGTP diphosphatase [Desertibacillus haloalkaliphilus]|uniref:8-oxo-dGTP diphosphatase n=1 Tax=Desertibacillus haloalkaliphilus TaxID=1328930 RepID=UPI001C25DF63|nr:8-oxo-dGTP diphosphatase [Desertibacillus haloalkaliphilus]MBU8906709.1 8-oxo-dGTP diphosphatase [Desertibacillus haloalkaliphilus]